MSRGLSPTLFIFMGDDLMEQKNNATCSICGKPYYVCLGCKESMNLHPYKMYCCSSSHFQVFQAVRGFSTGVYTKDEFKSKLKNIDLSDLEDYRDHIKTLIKDVLKEDEVAVETPVIEEVVTEEIIENMVVEKPIYSRKRNYKMEAE